MACNFFRQCMCGKKELDKALRQFQTNLTMIGEGSFAGKKVVCTVTV